LSLAKGSRRSRTILQQKSQRKWLLPSRKMKAGREARFFDPQNAVD
jgi:hypothetical protein